MPKMKTFDRLKEYDPKDRRSYRRNWRRFWWQWWRPKKPGRQEAKRMMKFHSKIDRIKWRE